jgi:hypothetical protein
MIIANDIILKLIKEKGYKNNREFCTKNGIDCTIFSRQLKENAWTSLMLGKVGKGLGKDLSFLVNARVGREKQLYDTKQEI